MWGDVPRLKLVVVGKTDRAESRRGFKKPGVLFFYYDVIYKISCINRVFVSFFSFYPRFLVQSSFMFRSKKAEKSMPYPYSNES